MLEIQELKTALVGSNIKRLQKLEIIRYLNIIKDNHSAKNGHSVIIEMSEAEGRKVMAKLENEREWQENQGEEL